MARTKVRPEFYDYEFSGDDLAREYAEEVAAEVGDAFEAAAETFQFKSSDKLNQLFEDRVNEVVRVCLHNIFMDAKLEFSDRLQLDNDIRLTLQVWSDAEKVHEFDFDVVMKNTVKYWRDYYEEYEEARRREFAARLRALADELEKETINE